MGEDSPRFRNSGSRANNKRSNDFSRKAGSRTKSSSSSSKPWNRNTTNNSGSNNGKKPNDDGGEQIVMIWSLLRNVAIKATSKVVLQTAFGVVVTLYVLNQNHLLPRPISSIVSRTLFWPTMPITASRRIGKWVTRIDETVVMGGAPFGFLNYPEKLYQEYNVRGVINFCEEYNGPIQKYKKLGMEYIRLPTTDHFEPSLEDLKTAVDFINEYHQGGIDKGSVYVHCRAGNGRSAAAVFSWLISQEINDDTSDSNPNADSKKDEDEDEDNIVDLKQLNAELRQLRKVRRTLWTQPNINRFLDEELLKRGGGRTATTDQSSPDVIGDDREAGTVPTESITVTEGGDERNDVQETIQSSMEEDGPGGSPEDVAAAESSTQPAVAGDDQGGGASM